MAVNTPNIVSGPYTGNGSADTYSYNFRIKDKTQIKVFETDDNGVEVTLTVDVDYTVDDIGIDAGGTVTRVAGNLPTGYTWYIRSDYKTTQKTAFSSQGGFTPRVHEDAFDKLTFLIQQLYDLNARTFRISDSDTDVSSIVALPSAATRANKVLSFDTVGDLITILELGVWRADWLTATVYKYRDMFRDPLTNTVYFVQTAHTSSTVVDDLASNYISVLLDGNPATTNFVPRTSTTGSAILPIGTTAQRDVSPVEGYIRRNTTTDELEEWNGIAWRSVAENVSYAVSGTDTYTATLGINAYRTNKTYHFSFTNTNTVTAPTINLDSLGVKTIKMLNGSALVAGTIPDEALLRYDGVDMILLNPVEAVRATSATSATSATTAGSITGQGALATLNTVSQTEVAANAIGQSEIKETNQDLSVATGAGVTDVLLTAPQHNFLSTYSRDTNGGTIDQIGFVHSPRSGGSFLPNTYLRVGEALATSGTAIGRTYYINSSPPYISADGEIPLFMFGIVDNGTGQLESVAASIDPPWMYNGSTNTVADAKGKNGEYLIKKRLVEVEIPNWRELQVKGKLADRKMISRRLQEDEFTYIPITQEIKNADMNEVPHPFINVGKSKTVVYLDPVSPVMQNLYDLHSLAKTDASAPAASELLHNGNIIIGNQDLNRDKPLGLMCVSLRWK